VHSTWIQGIVGFAAGMGLSLGLIALAPRLGWVDHPDQGRKRHRRPTARTGGVALWGVLILAQWMGWLPWPIHRAGWLGIHAMALIGALDDRFSLRARYKALVGLVVAAVLAAKAASGMARTVDHVEFFDFWISSHPALTFPFLFFWYWSIPQAFNLIDGINGLSMGFGLLVLGALGWRLGAEPAVLWGALLATLLLNFPRAKHFLGDCGALMLGTLFATLCVKLLVSWDADLPVWVFAYPIVDVTLVVAIRSWKGLPLSQADRSHLHHWMMDRFSQRSWVATPILLTFAFLPMLRATDLPGARGMSLVGVAALLILGLKAFLDRILPAAKLTPTAQTRREVPLISGGVVREPSGTHRAF
jgi:UDP-GlcNAc:undecaprenyl-phosphate GlcNAc-1-phosphate transferase